MSKAKVSALSTDKPHAWIVRSTDRGRKSIKKGGLVYLEDSQEFQIELYNPLKESILADIKMNGKSISTSGLVIKPGQRFYLDCFPNERKKFVFNTYEVEDTNVSIEAISNNGKVEVYFFKEETLTLNNWNQIFTPIIERRYYPVYPWGNYWWNGVYYGSPTFTTGISTTTLGNSYVSTNVDLNQNISFGSTNTSNLSNTSFNSSSPLGGNILRQSSLSSNIETGRVEKGEFSSQSFTEVEMNFEKYHISHVSYQILPESRRPIETKELSTNFCSSCGRKLKGSENFCPKCGQKLK